MTTDGEAVLLLFEAGDADPYRVGPAGPDRAPATWPAGTVSRVGAADEGRRPTSDTGYSP